METRRLIIRRWTLADAEALFKYASDPDIGPAAGCPPHKDVEESRKIIKEVFNNQYTWAMELKETGGFRDTGKVNWCSNLYRGDECPVKKMNLPI